MAATLEEVAALKRAFEREHRKPARALAELLVVGNALLEVHDSLDGEIGDAFEEFVLRCLDSQGVGLEELKRAVEAVGALRATLVELDNLPD
jgi:hypothetical protein